MCIIICNLDAGRNLALSPIVILLFEQILAPFISQ